MEESLNNLAESHDESESSEIVSLNWPKMKIARSRKSRSSSNPSEVSAAKTSSHAVSENSSKSQTNLADISNLKDYLRALRSEPDSRTAHFDTNSRENMSAVPEEISTDSTICNEPSINKTSVSSGSAFGGQTSRNAVSMSCESSHEKIASMDTLPIDQTDAESLTNESIEFASKPENFFCKDQEEGGVRRKSNESSDENEEMAIRRKYSSALWNNWHSEEYPSEPSTSRKRESLRSHKRKSQVDEFCPVCGVTVRFGDLDSHYHQEVDKLSTINKTLKKPKRPEHSINQPFVDVQRNRQNRLTAKIAFYQAVVREGIQCPVCKLRISGTVEDMSNHVELCLIAAETNDEDIIVDDDDSDSFEEYEIGDETRIRPISMVPGGYRALEGQTVIINSRTEEENTTVDIDDTMEFGQPQYTEVDVIRDAADNDDESATQLRKALIDPTVQPNGIVPRKWLTSTGSCDNEAPKEKNASDLTNCDNNLSTADESSNAIETIDPVVAALKEKIKALEQRNDGAKCLICMEPFTTPLVSTTCWHVYCEECWLTVLGNKKLCPHCSMIVFPSDLRKIYL